MNKIVELVTEIAKPIVEAQGCELWDVEYVSEGGQWFLRIYIDKADGVSIEDCEAVSREVSAQLDVADPISGNYTLEVSSPGLDRPLFTPAHFARFLGEQAKVSLKLPQDGRRRLQGRILRAEAGTVVFALDGAEFAVAADNIDKARLVPDWAALGLAPNKYSPSNKGKPAPKTGNGSTGKQSSNKPAAGKPHAG